MAKIIDQRLTTYTVLPSVQLKEKHREAQDLVASLESWKIIGGAMADQAGELLKQVHGEVKKLDAMRLEVGKPAREAQKDINDFFRPTITQYKTAEAILKGQLEDYRRKIEEENRKAFQAVSQGNKKALEKITPVVAPARVRYRNDIKIEIEDMDKVPRQYLTVDWSALRILARSGADAPEGVRFLRDQKVVIGK